MKSSEYKDNKLFNAILWLGALEALEAIAENRTDKALIEEFTAERKKAQASTEAQFWNEELGYYQYNAHNTDIMADATVGQRYVDVTGLPSVVNADRLTSHYWQLFRRAVLPLRDFNGDGVGDMGAANAQDMLTRFTQWQGREPESVAADTTYGNGEFLHWLADRPSVSGGSSTNYRKENPYERGQQGSHAALA